MSDAPTKPQIADYLKPGLDAGRYTITADHAVDLSGTGVTGGPDSKPATRTFVVQGPRFALDLADLHGYYPPANADGPFVNTFPHVVLTTRTLPWEREVDVAVTVGGKAQTISVPWLALLVLDAVELPAAGGTWSSNGTAAPGPTGAVTMDVATLVAGGTDVDAPAIDVSADEAKLRAQVLRIPTTLWSDVAPKPLDLPFLAHVRQLDVDSLAAAPAGTTASYAIVAGNRTPAQGSRGVVHLVSLEGHESLLGGTATGTEVWLVSLASWSFTETTVAGGLTPENASFGSLAAGLAQARTGERGDLALGLPDDGNDAVTGRLTDGYVPVDYHLPTGEDTFAWYRGPFTARRGVPLDPSLRPFASSSAALVYDPATGLFDVSLAVAWEIGRAIALADRKFATELVRFRRGVHRLVDLVLGGLQSKHLDAPGNLAEIARNGIIEQRFLDLLRGGLPANVAALSQGATPVATGRVGSGPARSASETDPVAAVKALLADPDLQALVAGEVAEDLRPIADWLVDLTRLHLVPFAYLVPDPGLLPDESIRFFEVDPDWIGALFDGALSVGVQSRRDSWFQQVAQTIVPDAWKAADTVKATAGLLVRSALVSGWPGLTIEASAGATPVQLVRTERLAPNLLLCLFSDVPTQVDVLAPHQGLHFAVDTPLSGKRVLDVAAEAKAAGATGAAAFAVHMLTDRERLRFTRA